MNCWLWVPLGLSYCNDGFCPDELSSNACKNLIFDEPRHCYNDVTFRLVLLVSFIDVSFMYYFIAFILRVERRLVCLIDQNYPAWTAMSFWSRVKFASEFGID